MLLDAPDMRARVGEYQARMLADGYSAKNHGLRHTVGTVLGEHVNAFKVQAFLGHADLSTTRRYVRDTADGLPEAVRVLELASPQVTAT